MESPASHVLTLAPPHRSQAARQGLNEVHPPLTIDKARCIDRGICRDTLVPFVAQ
jgi:hypothetical protein